MPPRVRPLAASYFSDSEGEDDAAPEAISLSHSKKEIQKLEAERRTAEIQLRKGVKAKNKEMDRRLKERAEKNKGKKDLKPISGNASAVEEDEDASEDGEEEGDALEERMRRAMQEAADESGDLDSDGDDEEVYADQKDEDDGQENSDDQDSASLDSDEDDSTPSSEEEETESIPQISQKIKFNPDHLPDELFTAAFSSSAPTTAKRKGVEQDSRPLKKRKSSKAKTSKDIVTGSRAIRVLPNSSAPPIPSTTPSAKIKKFLDRTLAIKGDKQSLRSKGWERRPVNIGLLKRTGPAVSFVRNP